MRQGNSENRFYQQAGPDGLNSRLVATGEHARLNQDNACKVLKKYFDDLELFLAVEGKTADITQLQAIWLEIVEFLQAEKNHILDDGYTRLLNRLAQIYTRGLQQQGNLAFAATAANYADVIEIVSQAHPSYDYSEVIGHLIHYMNQLYKVREKSWLRIFEHLLSMSDSIRPIQYLRERHLKGIKQWIEEGVDNLFQIRDDQVLLHSEKIAELAETEQSIEQTRQRLAQSGNATVVPITWPKELASLKTLTEERDLLIADLENRQELVDLLENNIQEFEDKLFATRRACTIRLLRD
jgi:hypothetical protein